jgi:selenocysteine lyase/cysteine desulfurase
MDYFGQVCGYHEPDRRASKDGWSDPMTKRTTSRTRRRFLSALAMTSMAGVAHAAPAGRRAGDIDDATSTCGQATQAVQSEYLFAPGLTYLNTAALGPTPRAVLNRTWDAWRELESNPVNMAYGNGPTLAAADQARTHAADLLGCTADEILITRSTTDAVNSVAQGMRLSAGDRVLTSDQEHEGGRAGWHYRARRDGVALDVVPIAPTDHDSDAIVQRFAAAITPSTRILSVSHVITSTGLRMPIPELAMLARRHGIFCIVDGAQAVGQIDVNVKSLGCHAYATAGHKWLMGPKGTGLLYVSREAAGIEPIQWEYGRTFIANSIGMGSLPLAVGLAAALEAVKARGMPAIERHNRALRDRAYAGLMEMKRLEVVSPPPGPLATALIAVRLPAELDSERVKNTLRDKHGVIVKMIEKQWFNGIRLSPHVFNTEADVDTALRAIRTELA